jgi:hypothetical protein
MALLVALTLFQHLVDGFHNRDLRGMVADLLGVTTEQYTASQMTYDLRRLRLKGPDLSPAADQPLLRQTVRLEGRAPLFVAGLASLPPGNGDVHRQ